MEKVSFTTIRAGAIKPVNKVQKSVADELIFALTKPKVKTEIKDEEPFTEPTVTLDKSVEKKSEVTTVKLSNRNNFAAKRKSSGVPTEIEATGIEETVKKPPPLKKVNTDWINFLKKRQDTPMEIKEEVVDIDEAEEPPKVPTQKPVPVPIVATNNTKPKKETVQQIPKTTLMSTVKTTIKKQPAAAKPVKKDAPQENSSEKDKILKNLLDQVSQLETSLGSNIAKLESQLKEEQEKNKKLEADLDTERENYTDVATKIVSIEKNKSNSEELLKKNLKKIEDDLSVEKKLNAELSEKIKDMEKINKTEKKSSVKLSKEVSSLTAQKEELTLRVASLVKWKENATAGIKACQKQCEEEHSKVIEDLQSKNDQKSDLILEMSSRIPLLISDYSSAFNTKQKEVSDLKAKLVEKEDYLREKEKKLRDVEHSLKEREIKYKEKEEKEAKYKEKVDKYREKEDRYREREDRVKEKEKKFREREEKFHDLENKLKEKERKFKENEDKLRQKEDEMFRVYELVNQLQQRMKNDKTNPSIMKPSEVKAKNSSEGKDDEEICILPTPVKSSNSKSATSVAKPTEDSSKPKEAEKTTQGKAKETVKLSDYISKVKEAETQVANKDSVKPREEISKPEERSQKKNEADPRRRNDKDPRNRRFLDNQDKKEGASGKSNCKDIPESKVISIDDKSEHRSGQKNQENKVLSNAKEKHEKEVKDGKAKAKEKDDRHSGSAATDKTGLKTGLDSAERRIEVRQKEKDDRRSRKENSSSDLSKISSISRKSAEEKSITVDKSLKARDQVGGRSQEGITMPARISPKVNKEYFSRTDGKPLSDGKTVAPVPSNGASLSNQLPPLTRKVSPPSADSIPSQPRKVPSLPSISIPALPSKTRTTPSPPQMVPHPSTTIPPHYSKAKKVPSPHTHSIPPPLSEISHEVDDGKANISQEQTTSRVVIENGQKRKRVDLEGQPAKKIFSNDTIVLDQDEVLLLDDEEDEIQCVMEVKSRTNATNQSLNCSTVSESSDIEVIDFEMPAPVPTTAQKLNLVQQPGQIFELDTSSVIKRRMKAADFFNKDDFETEPSSSNKEIEDWVSKQLRIERERIEKESSVANGKLVEESCGDFTAKETSEEETQSKPFYTNPSLAWKLSKWPSLPERLVAQGNTNITCTSSEKDPRIRKKAGLGPKVECEQMEAVKKVEMKEAFIPRAAKVLMLPYLWPMVKYVKKNLLKEFEKVPIYALSSAKKVMKRLRNEKEDQIELLYGDLDEKRSEQKVNHFFTEHETEENKALTIEREKIIIELKKSLATEDYKKIGHNKTNIVVDLCDESESSVVATISNKRKTEAKKGESPAKKIKISDVSEKSNTLQIIHDLIIDDILENVAKTTVGSIIVGKIEGKKTKPKYRRKNRLLCRYLGLKK